MGDFNSTSPELYHQVNHNETPSHYERRLDSFPAVSEKTWRVIIDTENNVATILVSGETKKETQKLNSELATEWLTKEEIAEIDKKYSVENLDWVLKYQERKFFVEVSLNEIYNWKFNENNDVIIWNRLIKKWTDEYNKIMTEVLEDFKVMVRAFTIDAKSNFE